LVESQEAGKNATVSNIENLPEHVNDGRHKPERFFK